MSHVNSVILIDRALLDTVSTEARAHPRRRKNRNFHAKDTDPGHRLLNAIEPDSYVAPHRHLDPQKGETMLVLRGRLGLVIFADDGTVRQAAMLAPGSETVGVDLPHGCWHSVLALETGTVFCEAKSGPYLPLTEEERAPWAPPEGDPIAASSYLEKLRGLFGR